MSCARRVAWVLVVALAAACSGESFSSGGGSGGNSGSAGSSGSSGTGGAGGSGPLNTNRTLDTLSASEQEQLCDELRGEVAATTDGRVYRAWACTVQAWTAHENDPEATRLTQCQETYQSCLARNDVMLATNIGCDEILPSLDVACTTVAAMHDCYHRWGPGIEQAYNNTLQDLPATCAEAAQAGGVTANLMGVPLDVPSQCLDIRMGCGL